MARWFRLRCRPVAKIPQITWHSTHHRWRYIFKYRGSPRTWLRIGKINFWCTKNRHLVCHRILTTKLRLYNQLYRFFPRSIESCFAVIFIWIAIRRIIKPAATQCPLGNCALICESKPFIVTSTRIFGKGRRRLFKLIDLLNRICLTTANIGLQSNRVIARGSITDIYYRRIVQWISFAITKIPIHLRRCRRGLICQFDITTKTRIVFWKVRLWYIIYCYRYFLRKNKSIRCRCSTQGDGESSRFLENKVAINLG